MNKLLNYKNEGVSFDKEMEKISPFELKNRLIELADESIRKMAHTMLNAGRGNPNWVATLPREAFFLLGEFAINECKLNWECEEGFAGTPQKSGIAARFKSFIKEREKNKAAQFLEKCFNYMIISRKSCATAVHRRENSTFLPPRAAQRQCATFSTACNRIICCKMATPLH